MAKPLEKIETLGPFKAADDTLFVIEVHAVRNKPDDKIYVLGSQGPDGKVTVQVQTWEPVTMPATAAKVSKDGGKTWEPA